MCIAFNPVEAVLFLILAFCNAAALLFMFHAEFLGLIFIIIYVGAIAVLFLFVIMMLNVKNEEFEFEIEGETYESPKQKWGFLGSYFVGTFIGLMIGGVFFLVYEVFHKGTIIFFKSQNKLLFMVDNLNNIDVMGQVLFNYFLICFLLAGIVLLIALIGSIVLTLRFNNTEKGQFVNRQLARTDNFLAFYK